MEDQLAEIEELFEDADTSLIKSIIYFNGWSDWEECGGYLIFEGIDDSIQMCSYGYCVMASDNTNYFHLTEISLDQSKVLIKEMEDAINDIT
jgi:hypothetical protein